MRTLIGVNDPQAVKKWASLMTVAINKASYWAKKFVGEGKDARLPIQRIDDLESGAGDEVIPTDCVDVDSAIDLDAIYEGPLIDYVCYRAWAQDSDNPGDASNAANAVATFMQALTGKSQSDQATRPARK